MSSRNCRHITTRRAYPRLGARPSRITPRHFEIRAVSSSARRPKRKRQAVPTEPNSEDWLRPRTFRALFRNTLCSRHRREESERKDRKLEGSNRENGTATAAGYFLRQTAKQDRLSSLTLDVLDCQSLGYGGRLISRQHE